MSSAPRAYVLLRDEPWYRKSAFVSGLAAAGYQVSTKPFDRVEASSVLVIWNRYAGNHEMALRFEQMGGRVLVAENGYLGLRGASPKFSVHPHGPKPEDFYCIAPRFHNDSSLVRIGTAPRFERLGVELKPWRESGSHILICPNRSFGIEGRAMHPDWAQRCLERLRKVSKREIRVRQHPGNSAPRRPLAEDLRDAWAVVIWSSSCGVSALAEGIPVFVEAPYWIMKGAGAGGSIEAPLVVDRYWYFEQMAWSQWSCEEISNGDPFRHLLSAAG